MSCVVLVPRKELVLFWPKQGLNVCYILKNLIFAFKMKVYEWQRISVYTSSLILATYMTKQSLKHKSPCLVLSIKHEYWHIFTSIRQDAVIMCGHSSSHTEALISECWLRLFVWVINFSCEQPYIGITRLKKDPLTMLKYNLHESAKHFQSTFYFFTKHCQLRLFQSHAIPSFPQCPFSCSCPFL